MTRFGILSPARGACGPVWAEARARLEMMEPATSTLLGDALDRVESGWEAVRPLQSWASRERAAAAAIGDYGSLLTFAEAELCKAFRSVALALSRIVEDWPGCERASAEDADGRLTVFGRHLTILGLATRAAAVPPAFHDIVRDLGPLGEDGAWYRGLSESIRAVGEQSAAERAAQEAAAAVGFLTHALPDRDRPGASRRVVAGLEALYRGAGAPPPWLELLRAHYSA